MKKLKLIEFAEEKGIEQGIEQGKQTKAIETARIMISDNESLEKIAKYTGLELDFIEALMEEMKLDAVAAAVAE